MRGSIRELPSGSWEIRVYVPDPVTGRKVRRSTTVRGTKRDAERVRSKLVAEVLEGVASASDVSLDWFAGEWLDRIAPTVRETTLGFYRSKIGHVRRRLGKRKLRTVEPRHIQALYAELAERLSQRSVLHVHRVLGHLMRDAVRWGHIPRSPMDRVEPPRVPERRAEAYSMDELRAFLAHVEGDRWEPLWRLYAFTGMRRAEALGVTWDVVDLDAGTVRVDRTVVDVGGRPQISEGPKTDAGRRVIHLDARTVELLEEYRDAQERRLGELGVPLPALVFSWDDGRPIDPNLVSKWFRRHREAAGLPGGGLHRLRHTHATLGLAAGLPAKVVQERLGHASIRITLDTYTHVVPELKAEAAERLAELVEG